MSYKTLSELLPALNNPNRITKKESFMSSFLAGLQNPDQGKLKTYPKTPILSEFWIPETNTDCRKKNLRRLDGFKITTTTTENSLMKSSLVKKATIYEYKIGPLTVEDIINTLYIKNYPNCIINGTNKTCRSNPNSLKSLYNKIGNPKNALRRLPDIDVLNVALLSDRITLKAFEYIKKINETNPCIFRVSKNKQIKIVVTAITYKRYIEGLNNEFNIQWFHEKDINSEIENISNYKKDKDLFTKINCITGKPEVIENNLLVEF